MSDQKVKDALLSAVTKLAQSIEGRAIKEPSVEVCRERMATAFESAIDELLWAQQWLTHVDSGLLEPDLLRAIEIIRSIKEQVSP
jgi:hypothetical protein